MNSNPLPQIQTALEQMFPCIGVKVAEWPSSGHMAKVTFQYGGQVHALTTAPTRDYRVLDYRETVHQVASVMRGVMQCRAR